MGLKEIKWRIVFSLVLQRLTDILLSAKTSLPTLMNMIGAPSWMLGLLVPIRESASLLPQALFSEWLSKRADRQKAWLMSMGIQLAFITSLVFIPLFFLPLFPFDGALLGGAVVLLSLLGFSLAKAMTSLTMKDIQGAHLEKGMRGRVSGVATLGAGIISLSFATFSLFNQKMSEHILVVIGIVCCFALILCVASLASLKTCVDIKQKDERKPRRTESLGRAMLHYFEGFKGDIARFIIVRACFVHTALIAPFYIVWVTNLASQNLLVSLSSFIIAQASASILSAYFWGGLADKSAKLTMQLGAGLVLMVAISSVVLEQLGFINSMPPLFFVLFYFVLCVGHEGARSGRKIYALDIKAGADRTDFIGKANTAIGFVILILGVFYSMLSTLGYTSLFVIMSIGLCVGIYISFGMKAEK